MKKLFSKSKKGFTIVELVIVIGVIGILSAILIPTFVNLNSRATEAALKSDLAAVYASYVDDVADGYYGVPSGNQKADTIYGQKEIAISKESGKFYVFTDEKGWGTTELSKEQANVTDDNPLGGAGNKYGKGYTVYKIGA